MTPALPAPAPPPRRLAAPRALALALATCAAVAAPLRAAAQTTVTAFTGQTCAGTRALRNLGCTSNDFTTTATFTQPPPGLASCVAGSTIQLDVIMNVTSHSPTRYDGAVFLGERANDPSLQAAGNTCSIGVFPTSPAPFQTLDGDACGDFAGTSSADLTIRGVKVYCSPAPGTNVLGLPYLLVFDNQSQVGCTAANVTAAANSKCVSSVSAQVTGVIVQGYVRVTVATLPAASPQAFAFTASGTGAASPSSFSLASGATQVVQVPLGATGGDVTLQLDEATVPGWRPGATISCKSPSGGAAAYVTTDGPNRRIRATLNATNYGANCTITNEQLPTLAKAFSPASVAAGSPSTLSLTVANPALTAQAGLGFTDAFPAGLVVAGPLAASSTCGGTFARAGAGTPLAPGDPGFTFSGGSLAAGAAACTLSVAVSSSAPATYTNGPAQVSALAGGLWSAVTNQALTVYAAPNLLLVESADRAAVIPGEVVTYTLVVQNAGAAAASSVVLGGPLNRSLAWRPDAFGPGVAFQLVDGSPASGLSLGAPAYSADGGVTWTLVPVSGGGGAPAGSDGRVTSWRLPMTGTMPAGRQFTLQFQATVK